jgi:hypothetical protein
MGRTTHSELAPCSLKEGIGMAQLFEGVMQVIELLLQGAFAALLVWYGVSLYHPLSHILGRYLLTLWRPLVNRVEPPPARRPYVIILVFAVLYSWGVLSNAFNYWLLRPVQSEIILAVRNHADALQRNPWQDATHALGLILSRPSSNDTASYVAYLRDDARWRNNNPAAHASILPTLRKFIRILRGAVISGYILVAIAVVKIVCGAVAAVVVAAAPRSRLASYLYVYFVDYEAYRRREEDVPAERLDSRSVQRQLLLPNLVLLLCGAVLLVASLVSYKSTEVEYQLLVRYGAETSVAATEKARP